jgi:hypothetical protein
LKAFQVQKEKGSKEGGGHMKTKHVVFLTVVLFVLASFVCLVPNGNAATEGAPIPKHPGVTVQVLVKGSPIHGGANGICVGPDDNLYISSAWGAWNHQNGPQQWTYPRPQRPGARVFSPDDLVRSVEETGTGTTPLWAQSFSVAADGDNLLVASIFYGVIQEYDPLSRTVPANYTGPNISGGTSSIVSTERHPLGFSA